MGNPVAMIHVAIPVDLTPWNTDEEIEAALNSAVAQITFPEDAHVKAWIAWLPDPTTQMPVVSVQDGFYTPPTV